MSPWWREEISVQLAAAAFTVVRRSRGLRRRELERHSLAAPDCSSAWQSAVETMAADFAARQWRNASLAVTLHGNLVRYLVLPWVENLSDRDALVYAQQSFAELHGAAAQNWAVCVSEYQRAVPRIAAATDPGLLAALQTLARTRGMKLCSVRPVLCAAVQDLARVDTNFTGWLALVEGGHSCIARFSAGACMTVRTARFAEPAERHLLTQLEQDAFGAGIEVQSGQVYIHPASPSADETLHAHGWRPVALPAWTLA